MLCVLILYTSGGTYSFKVHSGRQIWETFHGNFIYFYSRRGLVGSVLAY